MQLAIKIHTSWRLHYIFGLCAMHFRKKLSDDKQQKK
jgi:hypothetical protein